MPKELIADNEFYTIEVDSVANRSYSVCRGFWPDTDEFKKGYIGSIQKALMRLRPGFTTVVDIRDMKVPPQGLGETILKVQAMQKEAGLKKSARISDQPIQTMAAERLKREGAVEEIVRNFNSFPEAMAWLDA